jgi:hypothetical protein
MTTVNIKFREKIIRGLEITYQKLINTKIERNLDMVISKNGKVMHVDPRSFKK